MIQVQGVLRFFRQPGSQARFAPTERVFLNKIDLVALFYLLYRFSIDGGEGGS